MKTRIVVPMKPLSASKSRLRAALPDAQRAALALGMLRHVLAVLSSVPETDVVVAGGDEAVRRLCDRLGHRWREDRSGDLNSCLDAEFRRAAAENAQRVAFLPADLPLVSAADIQEFLKAGETSFAAIAPDRHGEGTNGLMIQSDNLLEFRLGEGSFRRHADSLARRNIAVAVVRRQGLELDIDTRDDLLLLEQVSLGRAAQLVLEAGELLSGGAGKATSSATL